MTAPPLNLMLSDLRIGAVLVLPLPFLASRLNSSPNEIVTAVTNLPLALLSLTAARSLYLWRTIHPLRAWVWAGMFGSLVVASSVGLFAHGLDVDAATRKHAWQVINAALALTVVCFVAGAALDGWGVPTARRMLPGLLVLGGGFFYYATFRSKSFLPFIIYESMAMLFSLLVYATLAARRHLAGAAWMTAGVAITMLAAVLQATHAVTFTLVVPFDHNGVFHLVQLPGLLCLFVGLRRGFKIPLRERPHCPDAPAQTRITIGL